MMLVTILFLIVATVYSMAGLAGGSSYLAILFLGQSPIQEVPLIALICNLIVSFIGTFLFFIKKDYFRRDLRIYLASSIPFSFIGGLIKLPTSQLKIVLGIFLLFSSLWIIITSIKNYKLTRKIPDTVSLKLIVGALIGFVSGFVGIGGGIFLAPIIYFFHWDQERKIAGLLSAFIFFNSLSGLYAKISRMGNLEFILNYQHLFYIVLFGAVLGNFISFHKFNTVKLKFITGIIIIIASYRLLFN